MKKSEMELDIGVFIEKLRKSDYDIPTNKDVMGFIFKRLSIVYLIQIVALILDFIMYREPFSQVAGIVMASFLVNFVVAFIFFIALYQPVSMYLSVGEEIIESSLVIRALLMKVRKCWLSLIVVNSVVGVILIFCGEAFIVGLGFSWFVTCIISMLLFQASASRYMTPALVSSLAKVKEVLSASPK